MLVLSRWFSLIGGVRARIERVPAGAIRAGAVLRGALVAQFAHPFATENFEGLAALQGADGATFLYVLSDDNFNGFQRTLLLLFHLDDD